MNEPSRAVYRGLKAAGIDFVVSVPCVNLAELLRMVESDPEVVHVPVTREEEGVGICAGAWMGGKSPAILMQNSGLGNSVNALASLNSLFEVPLLMIISHRGSAGEPIVAQVPMGVLTGPLLDVMGIPSHSPAFGEGEAAVVRAWKMASEGRRPAAVLFDLAYWRGL